jgi:peptide/nickel transport system substrate-binding protein
MRVGKMHGLLWLLLFLIASAGCRQQGEAEPTAIPAQPTSTATPAVSEPADPSQEDISFITVAIDAPARFVEFADIDPFGNVIGFDADVMATLSDIANFEYEFVVTSFDGIMRSVASGEFDSAMSAIVITDPPPAGIVFSDPYLVVGQVLVVRANETNLLNYTNIRPGIPIGVVRFSNSEQVARETVGISEPELQFFGSVPEVLQALIDNQVSGIIIDSAIAAYYTDRYPLQLKIAGGTGAENWISHKAYGIAVAANNEPLRALLNEAIGRMQAEDSADRLALNWLIPQIPIDAGESLVGTPADELVIGLAGELSDMDPASRTPELVSWEVKRNTMSGLLGYDRENNLQPLLATDFPLISEDKLEYTLTLRPDLVFPDGSELTAEDVRFSVIRSARLGNFLVNRYLKDANEDNFADEDSVQVVDPLTIKFVLKAPTSYFPAMLATPPFFVVNEGCFPDTLDTTSQCGGLGPYTIVEWELGNQMRLTANPDWPGTAPAFENIQLRFYDDPGQMRRSLENNAIDLAWTGLTFSDGQSLRSMAGFTYWSGPATFKSYLVFEQSEAPWKDARLRQAVGFAIDREALVADVFGSERQPLFGPVPDGTPGQVNIGTARDLNQARVILTASGYSPNDKLEMTIWYVNDGRYTELEEKYAQALKAQLEETGLIEVTLEGAPWEIFRPASLECNYPAYLLGWPSSGQPSSFIDAMSWMEYFITETDQVCSNYDSPAMAQLLEQALQETDLEARLAIYAEMQELWATELPTLDLTQQPAFAVSLSNVEGVVIDAMGLLHYDVLTKSSEE